MKHATETTLENLVNQIAHDVRNHAFTMGLQAEMGLRRAGNTPEIKAHFEAVLRQVDALKHYLEQLLLFGRPIRLTLTSVDLLALLREQVQRLQFGWDPNASPFDVKVEAEGQLRRGSWDPRALSHALLALLDNAVRSASPPPPVSARYGETTAGLRWRSGMPDPASHPTCSQGSQHRWPFDARVARALAWPSPARWSRLTEGDWS